MSIDPVTIFFIDFDAGKKNLVDLRVVTSFTSDFFLFLYKLFDNQFIENNRTKNDNCKLPRTFSMFFLYTLQKFVS